MMLAPELDARRLPVPPLRSYVRTGRPLMRFASVMQDVPAPQPLPSSARSGPTVVGFDSRHVVPFDRRVRSFRRGHEGFFPPVKKRGSVKSARSALSGESSPFAVYYPVSPQGEVLRQRINL